MAGQDVTLFYCFHWHWLPFNSLSTTAAQLNFSCAALQMQLPYVYIVTWHLWDGTQMNRPVGSWTSTHISDSIPHSHRYFNASRLWL